MFSQPFTISPLRITVDDEASGEAEARYVVLLHTLYFHKNIEEQTKDVELLHFFSPASFSTAVVILYWLRRKAFYIFIFVGLSDTRFNS